MVDLVKPDIILTHESDLDGFVSGLLLQRLARSLWNTDPPLEAYHYDNWRLRPMKEPVAWVADFTAENRLDRPGWLIVDHHPTDLNPRWARLIHDPAKSASLLCYELCRAHGLASALLDRLVRFSNIADLFLTEAGDFYLAVDYAALIKAYSFWNMHHLIGGQLERLLDHPLLEVMAVKRRVEDPIGFQWGKEHLIEITPAIGLVPALLGNSNLILHSLLRDPAVPYAVLLTLLRKGAGSMAVSLRSQKGEALKIATMLQGGGHANAAGATLPRSVQNIPDAVDYLRKVLNPKLDLDSTTHNLEQLYDAADNAAP